MEHKAEPFSLVSYLVTYLLLAALWGVLIGVTLGFFLPLHTHWPSDRILSEEAAKVTIGDVDFETGSEATKRPLPTPAKRPRN